MSHYVLSRRECVDSLFQLIRKACMSACKRWNGLKKVSSITGMENLTPITFVFSKLTTGTIGFSLQKLLLKFYCQIIG